MDIFDQATEAEERHRAQALAEQAAKAQLQDGHWRELSAKWCEARGCGARIPDERRRVVPGVKLCVECQSINEKQQRRAK
ncbi:MAG: conjugal transfer protein TraR [Betaproteobacteria bacterium]|nr:MAG: conjugal transfer protein TraR [Betaproteobacteria bacterium]